MKSRTLTVVITMAAMTTLTIPANVAAQEANAQPNTAKHHHYKFVDLGTLGGPHSYGAVNGDGFSLLNNSGVVASYADLNLPDPNQGYFCYDPDCYQAHAFQWKDGVMTDFGAIRVNNNSAAGSINSRGWMTGQSQSDQIDPVLGIPEFRGVLWKDGQIIDLGTLGAGTESLGIYVNDAGEVIGFSTIDTTPTPWVSWAFQLTRSSGETTRSWTSARWAAPTLFRVQAAAIRGKEWWSEVLPRPQSSTPIRAFQLLTHICGNTGL